LYASPFIVGWTATGTPGGTAAACASMIRSLTFSTCHLRISWMHLKKNTQNVTTTAMVIPAVAENEQVDMITSKLKRRGHFVCATICRRLGCYGHTCGTAAACASMIRSLTFSTCHLRISWMHLKKNTQNVTTMATVIPAVAENEI
jgi:hypothetical protein